MTNAEARFNNSLRPRKPEAQDGHLDSHTAPELCELIVLAVIGGCLVNCPVRPGDLICPPHAGGDDLSDPQCPPAVLSVSH